MIFTQTGHISKGLTVTSKDGEIENHSALTLVSLVTHTVGVCLRRALVHFPLRNNLPALSSVTVQVVLKSSWRKETNKGFEWAELLLAFKRGETDQCRFK